MNNGSEGRNALRPLGILLVAVLLIFIASSLLPAGQAQSAEAVPEIRAYPKARTISAAAKVQKLRARP